MVDGKLKLVGKTTELSSEFLKELKKNKQVLIDFLAERNSEKEEQIVKVEEKDAYAMTNAQQRIWVLSQFEGGNEAYNIGGAFHMKGEVRLNLFEKAFELSINKHESLRTYFVEEGGVPVQKILNNIQFKIDVENKSAISVKDAKEYINKFGVETFDLSQAPLIKVKILLVSDDEKIMLFNMHHIIGDGWSLGILLQEVMSNYRMLCLNESIDIAPLSIQFKDYSEWLSQRINGEFGEQARQFWREKELDNTKSLELPIDFPRLEKNSFDGARQTFILTSEFYKKIERLARAHQTTVFNVYRSALSLVLHKWGNQDRFVLGTPIAGRSHSQLADQIGLYVNTLPLISQYESESTFSEYIKRISKDSFTTFKYQDYPLDLLIEENGIKREAGRNPLFDVMMVVQNTAIGDGSIDKVNQHGFKLNGIEEYYEEKITERNDTKAKFDLSFSFTAESGGENAVDIEYKNSLFRKSTIQSLFNMLEYVITQISDNNDISLRDINIINSEEHKTILEVFNQPIGEYNEENILELIQGNLSSLEDIAVVDKVNAFTYNQLDTLSNGVGKSLMSAKGNRIGLFLSRTAEIISAILGVWKSGKTYVPVDTKYPSGRIQYILEDSSVETLIVDSQSYKLVPESFKGNCINIDEIEAVESSEGLTPTKDKDAVAYLIYTSGSTGQPKGVEITHRNAIAFLKWSAKEFANTPFEVMFAGTSYCFDLSVFEMLFPLSKGKKIRVLESAVEITDYIQSEPNIFINTVPSVVRSLLDQNTDWQNVVALNMAGEPVPKVFKDQLDYQEMEVRNLYGPSEDTTYSTCYRFKDDNLGYIPIGKPVGDTHLYILDDDENMLPIGVEGEICLSGQSIAKGYLNKPKLTEDNFIENHFIEGERMYRTGDIGKWSRDGHVVFVGRKDDQVKVRGFRIELGEIQYQLDCIDAIEQSVVMVKDVNSEKAIVAYYKPGKEIAENEITEALKIQLPTYMIPSFYVEMESIPMNSNGKVDKKKLPDLDVTEAKEIIEPKTSIQKKLLELWQKVLNVEGFGMESNFFELGGHSLKATMLRGMILEVFQKQLTLNEVFENVSIPEMAELIDSKPVYVEQTIEKISRESNEYTPLSFAQERLWVLTKFENASKAYYMPAAFKISGKLNPELLEKALINVINRHESLRTVFKEKNGTPYQFVQPISEIPFELEQIELEGDLESFLKNRWSKPFDLENGPLLRCALIETEDGKVLSFNMHHIISDGWSVGVLFNDVMKSYGHLTHGESGALAELKVQYKDFSEWQRKELSGEGLERQLNYWKNEVFFDQVKPLELPYDYHRPDIKTYNGATATRLFSKNLSNSIEEQASEQGVSLYMSIMANVSILLKKLSNQSDLVIGTPVSGRDDRQLQNQIGFYVNTLPIRVKAPGKETFISLVNGLRQDLLSAFDYQNFPFEMLVEEVQVRREMSRSPLFDVMVVMQNFDIFENTHLKLDDEIHFEKIELSSGHTKYDLTFSFSKHEEGIHLELEYNTDLFTENTINRYFDQLTLVLEQTTSNELAPISDISLMSKDEESLLLAKSDFTGVEYDKSQSIVSHFNEVARQFPDKIALKVENRSLTYRELDEKSGQLAAKLIKDYNIQDEELIVLHTHRSEWMMISILACLKAGAAYVPVDPEYPVSRIEYILEDSGARLLMADGKVSNDKAYLFESITWLDVTEVAYEGDVFSKEIRPEQLAYIIYTSGTTGNPKGVLIEHRNVSRLLFNENDYFDFNENDSWTLFHSYCFDFSVWEMYGAILKGGTLVMVPKMVAQDSAVFFQFLKSEKITVLNQTPTAFRSFCLTNQTKFQSTTLDVRYVIFGGEALMPSMLKEWHHSYPECKLINMYGITETTVHVTFKEIGPEEIKENKSNIGIPIPTLSCYVLDEDLKPCATKVIGELCVGGAGVARGYHNKQELTAKQFVENTINGEGRLYRSGDFARLLPNGDIEYIGRKDEQVKIRGHRIELAEAEEGIKRLPYIQDAVVLTTKNESKEFELVAYYIVKPNENVDKNLREELSEELPSYMIPTHYILLDSFPMTSNGKLDKKALPEVSSMATSNVEYVVAETKIEESIVAIWEEVLGKKRVGVRDNFFDLGGHSLKATRVISKIHEEFGVKVDLGSLFIDPTIASLAEHVSTLMWMLEEENVESSDEEMIL